MAQAGPKRLVLRWEVSSNNSQKTVRQNHATDRFTGQQNTGRYRSVTVDTTEQSAGRDLGDNCRKGKNIRHCSDAGHRALCQAVSTRLDNSRQTALHIGNVEPRAEAFEILSFARKMVTAATAESAGTVGIWVAGFTGANRHCSFRRSPPQRWLRLLSCPVTSPKTLHRKSRASGPLAFSINWTWTEQLQKLRATTSHDG